MMIIVMKMKMVKMMVMKMVTMKMKTWLRFVHMPLQAWQKSAMLAIFPAEILQISYSKDTRCQISYIQDTRCQISYIKDTRCHEISYM